MDQRDEAEIAAGLREGRSDAWRHLYDGYATRTWGWVARLLGGDRAEVADVVQETFLAAARSAHNYDPQRGSLWTWLAGVARNQAALHFRRRQRARRVGQLWDGQATEVESVGCRRTPGGDSPSLSVETTETCSRVRAALSELPADYGVLLSAKYCDGVSVEQLARQENCSSDAVRSKLARARRAFRRLMGEDADFGNDS